VGYEIIYNDRFDCDVRIEVPNTLEDYLEKYPKIKEYMDNTKNIAVEKGYVETKFGRRRYVPNIEKMVHITPLLRNNRNNQSLS